MTTEPERGIVRTRQPGSGGQRLLWLMELGGLPSGALNVPLLFDFDGDLDEGALDAALALLVERHEALRTSFDWEDDHVVQEIWARHCPRIERVDLSGCDAALSICDRQVERACRETLPLERPPMTVRLWRLGRRRWRLLIVLHHLITDAWSNRILSCDLGRLYSYLCGAGPALPEPLWQYRDYVAARRSEAGRSRLREARRYWPEALAGATVPTFSDAPLDTHAPGPGRLEAEISAPDWTAAVAAARAARAGMAGVLTAAFARVVSRSAGLEDFAFGTLLADRTTPESWDAVGMFVTMLLLRVQSPHGEAFTDTLGRVQRTLLRATAHQSLPFHMLARADRPAAARPEDLVLHLLVTPPEASVSFASLRTSVDFRLATLSSRFRLEIVGWQADGALRLAARFAPESVSPVTAGSLLAGIQSELASWIGGRR